MDNNPTNLLLRIFRGVRLAIHLVNGMLMAIIYPYLNEAKQRRTLKKWSRQLLAIFNIGIQIEGQQPARSEGGYLIVANHVSWLDIFVLNAIHPSRFIAKSEVRDWPIIGWLCQRTNTIFIERAVRQNAVAINQHASYLLGQGVSIGLFPEGTTTDGKQVGHFHSALIQPAIDAGVRLCPIALRYQDEEGERSSAAAFIGDTTLIQSIAKLLQSAHLNALVVFTPTLLATNENRRVLARSAQSAIAQALQNMGINHQSSEHHTPHHSLLASQSSYGLLVDPLLNHHD
jgi:1-acyl-sn-glycerol-3-phosphate acyltransferase